MEGLFNGGGKIFEGPFFTIRVPLHWELEIIENVPAFFDPDGAGALQIAAFSKAAGNVYDLEHEMEKYLNQNDLQPVKEKMLRFLLPSGLDCIAVEYVVENRFWMVNAIGSANKMLLVMYNSDEVPGKETALLISQMVSTIEFRA